MTTGKTIALTRRTFVGKVMSLLLNMLSRLVITFLPMSKRLFIIGDRNAKVGSQETPGIPGKLGLGLQNEAGQRLIKFCQENELAIANTHTD